MASLRGQHPWGGGPVPQDIEPRIDANTPPALTGARRLIVAEQTASWDLIECSDIGTGQPVAAIGGRVRDFVVAVAGPAGALDGLELETFPAL
jgi:hypothetical protein